MVTLLDIYGHSVEKTPHPDAIQDAGVIRPAESLPQSLPETLQAEQVWELPIGYALATAAAAWVVQALLMHYAMLAGSWAVVWPLNGVVAGLILGKRRRDWLLILFFVFISTTVHEGSVTGHWLTAAFDSLANAVEVLVVLAILPPFVNLQQWLRTSGLTARTIVANFFAAPAAAALVAATFYRLVWHIGFWHVFHQWALADAVGLGCTLPLILGLRSPASWSTRQPMPLVRSSLLLAGMAVISFGVFWHTHLSIEFILFPALGLVIFLSGFTGAMLAIELICCISVYRLLHRGNPAQLITSHDHDVLFLQLLLSFIAIAGFAAAVMLSERRAFAARYRSSERQSRLLAECSRDVIVLMNLEGICRFVSLASLEVLGYDPEALQGQPFEQGMHEEDVAACHSLLHDIRLSLATEGILTYRTTTQDGRSIWIEGRLRATTDEAGDVNGSIITLRDITENKRLQKELQEACTQLEHQAAFDTLTNVANRRRFDDIFDQEWRRAAREFQPLALLMINVDNFQNFSDTHGAQAGDECLRAIAHTLTTYARRPGDLVARWSAEEFAVLLPTTDLHGACEVAERARHAVETAKFGDAASDTASVTLSIGAAAIIPLPEMVSALLMEDADRALYLAKANGQNRVEYKPGPRPVRASTNTISFA